MKPRLKDEREKENFWTIWRSNTENNEESTTRKENFRRQEKENESVN